MRAVLTKGEVIVVTFKMNRRTLRVEEGTTVLEAARDAGIYIPTLCYHPALEPIGACRLCIVELSQGGRQSHVAACVTKVSEGIAVKTDTQAVAKIRRTVLELLHVITYTLAEILTAEKIFKHGKQALVNTNYGLLSCLCLPVFHAGGASTDPCHH